MEFRDSTGQLIKTRSMPLFTTPQAKKTRSREAIKLAGEILRDMTKLDTALNQLKSPSIIGQQVKGLPCDLCANPHTRVIAIKIEDYLAWEIHSPCLDKLVRLAVKRIA